MFACPHCNEKSISLLDKSFMGAFKWTSHECAKCGNKVGFSTFKYCLAMLPFVVSIFLINFKSFLPFPYRFILFIFGITVWLMLVLFWVPLVKK
jgi:hypothetical protein